MPTAQKIQPIVFLGRCQAIRAPTVAKRPKATPAQMESTDCNRLTLSSERITVAERIKDTLMPQAIQANRRAAPALAIFSANLYGTCMRLLLLSRWVKLSPTNEGLCLRILPYYLATVSKALRPTLRTARPG